VDASGSGWRLMAACFEYGNKPSGSVNVGAFLD
jgi:hypothetical protein